MAPMPPICEPKQKAPQGRIFMLEKKKGFKSTISDSPLRNWRIKVSRIKENDIDKSGNQ